MSFASALGAVRSDALQSLSRAFSAKSRLRSCLFEDDQSARLLRQRSRARDAFVQRSALRPAAAPAPTSLYASSTEARLRTSSTTVVRQEAEAASTTTLETERLAFRLRSAQLAVGRSGAASIADALEGQTQTLERVLDAAGLLVAFSGDLARDFLDRIGQALDDLGGDVTQAQAASLDVNIRVESETVRVANNENSDYFERKITRVDVRARFIALSASGDIQETKEPVQAGLRGQKGSLRGQGPDRRFDLSGFDLDGDGRFTVDDILALADETVDVVSETPLS